LKSRFLFNTLAKNKAPGITIWQLQGHAQGERSLLQAIMTLPLEEIDQTFLLFYL